MVSSRVASLIACVTLVTTLALAPTRAQARSASPLDGRAMWIWDMPATDHGELSSIIAGAHRYGVTALIIKSSDGTSWWSQFSPELVAGLHRAGLRVCAWQYVYGDHPGVEAHLGADARSDGADCLVIDAEVQYEGKYVAAQTYVRDLRRQVGAGYPVALAGLPYVDYHPGFPYSVFLGPGGAQTNMPQMYWRDIGTTVDAVFQHTYAFNEPYGRPIDPLGEVYDNPPARQIVRFRALVHAYGARGVSWWDWQEARTANWRALSTGFHVEIPDADAIAPMASVGHGARGDLVVWLQEHLASAGENVEVSGVYGAYTVNAVEAFQTAHGLVADGIVGPETWAALLRYRPLAVRWVHHGRQTIAADAIVTRPARGPVSLPVPGSASLRDRRNEIPAGLGAGTDGHTAPGAR